MELTEYKKLYYATQYLPHKFKAYCEKVNLSRASAFQIRNYLKIKKKTSSLRQGSHHYNLERLYQDELNNQQLMAAVALIAKYNLSTGDD